MTRIEPTLLQKINQRTILEVILQRGPSSRAEVVRYSGISAPTVSKAVATLLDRGLLEEGDSPTGVFGRPGKLLRLATENSQVIGIALEPQRCSIVSASASCARTQSTSSSSSRSPSPIHPTTCASCARTCATRYARRSSSTGRATGSSSRTRCGIWRKSTGSCKSAALPISLEPLA